MESNNADIESIFKLYDGFLIIESETEAINKSPEEILEAIKSVVNKNPKFKEIMAIDKYQGKDRILIKGNIYNKMLKRVMIVYLTPFNENITQIQSITRDNQRSTPPGLSRKLIKETMKELGMDNQAKKFSRESNMKEIKSLGKGAAGGIISLVKIVIFFIVILLIIGVIGMIL
jgi:hypothetical protein